MTIEASAIANGLVKGMSLHIITMVPLGPFKEKTAFNNEPKSLWKKKLRPAKKKPDYDLTAGLSTRLSTHRPPNRPIGIERKIRMIPPAKQTNVWNRHILAFSICLKSSSPRGFNLLLQARSIRNRSSKEVTRNLSGSLLIECAL